MMARLGYRKRMLHAALAVLSSCSLIQEPAAADSGAPLLPNILIVLIDDLGWGDLGQDLPGIGGRADHRTPHITAFAKESLVMTNGYSAAPNCAPSRASLQTGRYTPRHGILTVGSSARGKAKNRALVPVPNETVLPDAEITLAERLAPAGYTSVHLGKWHLGDDPRTQGYHVNIGGNQRGHPKSYFAPYKNPALKDGPDGEYLTTRLTGEAIAQMDELKPPFLMHLAYYTVHTPIQAPKGRVEERRRAGAKSPKYAAMVEAMDAEFGRLIAALEAKGLAKDTLVFFTSDNGGYGPVTSTERLRGFKGTLDEGGIRVPWIVRWPSRIAPGVTDAPVHHVDVAPTLEAVAGMGTDAGSAGEVQDAPVLDGIDLTALWLHRELPATRPLLWHFPVYLEGKSDRFPGWRTTPGCAFRYGSLKLVEYFGAGPAAGRQELFDLSGDPRETADVAAQREAEVQLLQARRDELLERLGARFPMLPEAAGRVR